MERERERERERAKMKRANHYFVAAPWLPSMLIKQVDFSRLSAVELNESINISHFIYFIFRIIVFVLPYISILY